MMTTKKELPPLPRDDNGHLAAFAWPGAYNIVYIVDPTSETICVDCARRWDRGEHDPRENLFADIYWEGPPMYCDDCGKEIKSEYGDPEFEQK